LRQLEKAKVYVSEKKKYVFFLHQGETLYFQKNSRWCNNFLVKKAKTLNCTESLRLKKKQKVSFLTTELLGFKNCLFSLSRQQMRTMLRLFVCFPKKFSEHEHIKEATKKYSQNILSFPFVYLRRKYSSKKKVDAVRFFRISPNKYSQSKKKKMETEEKKREKDKTKKWPTHQPVQETSK
jgi:hypothetical protein